MRRIYIVLPVLFGICLMFVASGNTYSSADLTKLLTTKQCPNCDLTSAPLSNSPLSNANFQNAKLSGADMNGTNLTSAILWNASASGATMIRATLYNADLSGTDLTNANLTNANLYGAKITPLTKLAGANLSGATWIDGRQCTQGSIGECKK